MNMEEMDAVLDRICLYLKKCGYDKYRVRIGGDIFVDIGCRIPKSAFDGIAKIANDHELSISHGVDLEK